MLKGSNSFIKSKTKRNLEDKGKFVIKWKL